jgi:anti-sigma B factor antagonist
MDLHDLPDGAETATEDIRPGQLRVRGRVEDGVAHLALVGDVDLATAQSVRGAVGEALDDGVDEIVVDLGGVSFLDSTGLGVLLHAARDAERRRAKWRSVCPSGCEARVVIELAGVGRLLGLEEAAAPQARS